MNNKVIMVNGMPVESPKLDPELERERERLNEICMREYKDTGVLTSDTLIKANQVFVSEAMKSLKAAEHPDDEYR